MPAMQVSIFVLLPPHLKRWKHRIRIVPLDLGRCCLNLEGEISVRWLLYRITIYRLESCSGFFSSLIPDGSQTTIYHLKKYNILKLGSTLKRKDPVSADFDYSSRN